MIARYGGGNELVSGLKIARKIIAEKKKDLKRKKT